MSTALNLEWPTNQGLGQVTVVRLGHSMGDLNAQMSTNVHDVDPKMRLDHGFTMGHNRFASPISANLHAHPVLDPPRWKSSQVLSSGGCFLRWAMEFARAMSKDGSGFVALSKHCCHHWCQWRWRMVHWHQSLNILAFGHNHLVL